MASIAERFSAKWEPEPNTGCWLWTGGQIKRYGSFGVGGRAGKNELAHRVSYELHVGPIPRGLCVLHRCDTPACVNPEHLFLGTQGDNMRDASRKGRTLAQAHPEKLPRGEEHHDARLTDDLVRTLRARHAAGERTSDLAREVGMSDTCMGRMLRGLTWTHVR